MFCFLNFRSKVNAGSAEHAKTNTYTFQARPLNRKVGTLSSQRSGFLNFIGIMNFKEIAWKVKVQCMISSDDFFWALQILKSPASPLIKKSTLRLIESQVIFRL